MAFLSERPLPKSSDRARNEAAGQDEPKAQIWLLEGGEPRPLTHWEQAVSDFAWRDARHVVFAAREQSPQNELARKAAKDTTEAVEDPTDHPPVRLFEVDLESGDVTRLTRNEDWITSLSVSPDGHYAVTFHDQSLRFEYDNAIRPRYFLTDLSTGTRRRIFADHRFNLGSLVWSADSAGFYVANAFTTDPRYLMATVGELWRFDVAGAREIPVPLDWERGLASDASPYQPGGFLTATPDGVLALLADGVEVKAAHYRRDGDSWRRTFVEGPEAHHLFAIRVTPAGGTNHVHAVRSTASSPPQLYTGRLDGDRVEDLIPVSSLNQDWKGRPTARAEVRHWTGAGGDTIEGLVYLPADHRPGERRPLVVMIHGGPFGASLDLWSDRAYMPIQLHSQRGALVLLVNYHGSSQYGLSFASSIAGGDRYYAWPVQDIEAGVDGLIDEGLVDPAKIGVLGWSNGAILTLALIIEHPERYQAAGSGAGGFEWVADTSITAFGQAFNDYYFGTMPWEDPERYRRLSPYYQADRIRTPLIIFHGDADTAVPIHHGWMQFRALQQRTDTPVRFLTFPGEPHGLKALSHLRRKVEEELAWFDRYLYRMAQKPEPWIKNGSPLAAMLARSRAAHAGPHVGLDHERTLIPETVRFQGLQVGRFEVTRAQFAEFDPGYAAPVERAEFPASNITFEQARRYCAWLSGRTGTRWRLPSVDEAARLASAGATTTGNTLDYWAGYAPNPEDTARLRAAAEALGPGSLMSSVGSHPGVGDAPVFDLDGNVAEWAVNDDGSGILQGASADQPAQSLRQSSAAHMTYTGFRVVRD